MGAKKRPFYRVVVADQREARDGRFIENIGKYHPLNDPSIIEIDEERALYWLRVGAQPSNQVRVLMSKTGIWDRFVAERPSAVIAEKPGRAEKPEKPKLSKKAAAKAAAPAEEAEAPPAAAAEASAPEVPEADAPAAEAEASEPEALAAEEPEASEDGEA
jgi:small subunit ribosomal protein S16